MLGTNGLAVVSGIYGDQVLMGDPFTGGLHIAIDPAEYLPIDVTIQNISPETLTTHVKDCITDPSSYQVNLPDGTVVPASGDGKVKFRLYPPAYAGLIIEDDSTGADLYARKGAGTTPDAIFKLAGTAPTATGISQDSIMCEIKVEILAVEVGGLDRETLNSVIGIEAFPVVSTPIPVGKLIGFENTDGDYGTLRFESTLPGSPSLPYKLFGAESSGSVITSILATMAESDSNAHDDDYMTVKWGSKEKLIVDSVETYTSLPVALPNGATTSVCLEGRIYDEDWGRGGSGWLQNDDDLIAEAERCWWFEYTQINAEVGGVLIESLPDSCKKLLGDENALGIRRDYQDCAAHAIQVAKSWNQPLVNYGDLETSTLGFYIPIPDGSGAIHFESPN